MKRWSIFDISVVVLLFAALLAWGPISQKFFPAPAIVPGPAIAATNAPAAVPPGVDVPSAAATGTTLEARAEAPVLSAPTNAAVADAVSVLPEETHVVLTNGMLRVELTSHGGGICSAELDRYPTANQRDSAPVSFNFRAWPAMSYDKLPGFDAQSAFSIVVAPGGRKATLEAVSGGVRLVREIVVPEQGYQVQVTDSFENRGATAVTLPATGLRVGTMGRIAGETEISGFTHLGIDSLNSVGGEKTRHWGSGGTFGGTPALGDFFQEPALRGGGCSMGKPAPTRQMPLSINERINQDLDWVAVKNKFFVQIVKPPEPCVGVDLRATRTTAPGEQPGNPASWAKVALLRDVSAALRFAALTLKPGETAQRQCQYYVGPKDYSAMRNMGVHMDDIMEFGWFKPVCIALLWLLNHLVALIPSYGLAIILVTLLVRGIFWPLTHKGTESMKRMQALQPEIKALKEKFRDKPQKIQQATMELYKKNKVNPMSGCLPILIQIPVFIALYNVLRSAVELRHAHFLWIHDLSEAENLFPGLLPIVSGVNFLPLIMTALSVWQTKITPSTGDPAQQRMMVFMPVIMLVFFYSMPSALVLYWTANQAAMIIQMLWHLRHAK